MQLHADHTIWQIIAHLMIAFLFLYRCLTAFPRFQYHADTIAARGVPKANIVLTVGLAFMLIGGVSVALDVHAPYGAGLLLVFTASANYLYHNFWDMEGPEGNRHLYTFCNNIAVMGGLVLVANG